MVPEQEEVYSTAIANMRAEVSLNSICLLVLSFCSQHSHRQHARRGVLLGLVYLLLTHVCIPILSYVILCFDRQRVHVRTWPCVLAV